MFILLFSTALLVGFGFASSPTIHGQDGFDLLLEAAAALVSTAPIGRPPGLTTDPPPKAVDRVHVEADDVNYSDNMPNRTRPEGTPTKTPENSSANNLPHVYVPRGGLRDESARMAREEKIREYVMANPDQHGPAFVTGLNAYLGHTYHRSSLAYSVRRVRMELGHVVENIRLSSAQVRQRGKIIDGFIAAHPRVPNRLLESPINALMEAAGLPRISHKSFTQFMSQSRRRLNIPAYFTSSVNAVERNGIIKDLMREHDKGTAQDMMEPLKPVLQASNLGNITEHHLRRAIRWVKRRSLPSTPAPVTTTPTSTTTEPTPIIHVSDHRDERRPNDSPREDEDGEVSAPRISPCQSLEAPSLPARHRGIRDFMSANPALKGAELISRPTDHLGTGQVQEDLGQAVRGSTVDGSPIRRREERIDQFIAANPRLAVVDMVESLSLIIEAEELPLVSKATLRSLIYDARLRRGMVDHVSERSDRAERRAIIQTFVEGHTGWSIARMVKPIQKILRANNLPISEAYLYTCISRIKREMAASTPPAGSVLDGAGDGIATTTTFGTGISSESMDSDDEPIPRTRRPGESRASLKRCRDGGETDEDREGMKALIGGPRSVVHADEASPCETTTRVLGSEWI